MSKVGIVGDIHEPATHPGYLSFIQDTFSAWDTDTVVFIGDIIDNHACSFHAKNPKCPGPSDEYLMAKAGVRKWYTKFPKATVTIGNHDDRVYRAAAANNIAPEFIRNYSEVWATPTWKWVPEVIIDNVRYIHGQGGGGMRPAALAAQRSCISTVLGHYHTVAGVSWMAGPRTRIFGMDVGCGLDDKAMMMAYAKYNQKKSILACGVVLDGIPYHEIMPCGPGEKYHHSKFKKRSRK